ncbi:pyridine nucleotide-disulfide oxidoreductase [Methylacidiphilum kamchatkense Kam1]|uniref:Pyridine nucleotide-disulfide oxidoreductase n=1 Tax=Methylacidiphilum kamchatkense Kam1 TaxID=1202785 RepID=A0A0C1UPV4_9BACT|nr:FAD/NAD(P)-binding oxidoreductase [Methylacidiphilum kamchatkense]KIE57813.1 pyridine nucleotide-disulfide oxidoreductase [Methylacidiphilum kamchatkense Kam1]QDQ41429.1 sulfide:quinone oxidoreductase [Methylacidiphilum kamchatkense Kam1]
MAKNILILGGGTGGSIVANILARSLSPQEASITVLTASPQHVYQPYQLYIPFGYQDPRKIARSERSLLHRRVSLVVDPVEELDVKNQKVVCRSRKSYPYDYLVIATGSTVDEEQIPGFKEGADHFYTPEAAFVLYEKLQNFNGGTIVVGIGGLPYKCPVAPVEFTFMLEEFLTKRGIRQQSEIIYTFPLNDVFNIKTAADYIKADFDKRNIKTELFFNLAEIHPEKKIAESIEGTELSYDLLVMTPPHKGAPFLRGHEIADADGWVQTDRHSLKVAQLENVWSLGDTTNLPVSKAGSTAHFQAPVIAKQICAAIRQETVDSEKVKYNGHVACFIESGYGKATMLDFDYEHPPQPPPPTEFIHFQKLALNKFYWYLIPKALI